MDDFGSILERDYGLGRAGKGRIGSRSSKNNGNSSGPKFDSSSRFSDSGPRFDSSTRFSDSFGRTKFGKGDLSGSFRGGGGARSDQQHGYARQESYGSSYSVYDEVFSCNVQSTIPVFEDVFRVPSSRMKVSELRDNDIFRGIPSLIKKSSNARVTYEDIFGEAVPDDLSAAVSLGGDAAGAKIATAASSRSNSGLGTPRKDAHPESTNDFPAQDLETKPAIQKPQGSFLGMSALKQNGHGIPQPAAIDRQQVSNDEFERAWVSVGEVSLTTRPSEIPPPARLAPDRSRASNSSFDETGSGPPPQRFPPPLSSQHSNNNASTSNPNPNPNSNSSELLEKVLRERSAHAELSIREKVLDWQKHNLAQEEEQRRRSPSSPSSLPSSPNCATPERKSRAEALRKLREERETVERIAAEVEAAAAEQARVRAERAAMEDIDRDARAELLSKQQQQQQDQNSRDAGAASKVGEQDTSIRRSDDEGKVAETIVIEQETKNEAGANGNNVEEDSSSDAVATSTSTSTPVFREEDARSEAPRSSSGGIEQEDSTSSVEKDRSKQDEASGDARESPQVVEAAAKDQTTDTESVLSIDSFTTNQASASTPRSSRNAAAGTSAASAAAAKEEEAPETPERIESTVRDHEKSNKSSDISVEDRDRGASSDQEKKILLEEQQKRELMEEARRARERSLVARITAEVRERAALEAKAKAEKAAMDRKKSSPAIDQQQQQHRRTRPRLKEQSSIEMAAKELEDRANSSGSSSSSSSAIPKGGGSTRVSLRQQLEKERLARIAADAAAPAASAPAPATDDRSKPARDQQQESSSAAAAKLREERTLVERMRAEARERAAMAKMEREREERERERVERINAARQRERERMEKLEKEREKERERVAREMEREREIEREKDRVGLEHKAAQERAEAAEAADCLKMERAAVERANAEARARAERAAYDAAASARAPPRPTSVPKQSFGNSASMPSSGNQTENGGIRRTTSSTNLESDRSTSSNFSREDFKELKGETPERRKARLERYQRTLNRAAQALALKNKRDLELQTEQAERQRLAERLDSDIKRWSVGKDGNIRALLSTLQYVLWPESGWKQVSLTELINPTAVKKAYRRATLCVHPDKMQQKHASVQQKYIAEKVFHILQVAWNKFNSHETI